MIVELRVENLAIIKQVEVHFLGGFSVMTGETGAGKSLLIDALELALGERADTELVRTGSAKASVQLVADLSHSPAIREWCSAESIELEENRLIIHREVYAEGRSQAKVNGRTIPVATLRVLGKQLVDLHGQHQHQSLFDPETHIEFLDLWIGSEVVSLKLKVAAHFETYTELKRRADALKKNVRNREQKIDMLRFQVDEISNFAPVVGEEEELLTNLSRMRNLERISQSVAKALDVLSEGESNARDLLGIGLQAVEEAARFDATLSTSDLETASVALNEGINVLSHYVDTLEMDPQLLETMDDRLDALRKLKRKYGDSEQEILSFLDSASRELSDLENVEASQETIEAEVNEAHSRLIELCETLSQLRHEKSELFTKEVQEHLKDLSMNRAVLSARMMTVEPTATGSDTLEFLFSANAGEVAKPLAKIASGGEISRVMLALKSVLAGRAGVPTLIFDEVDTGLGGQAATSVGRKIRELGKHYQVISISHLPQVAAQGTHQYRIEKSEEGGRVATQVVKLSGEERVDEIARMLAGDQISESARANARELLSNH
ncbi:MAG: DNA repair protein RecN [Fimbriimonadales bacterium]|nr:DNA repair protein RecN [Fimbriimonadales bacterium]